MTGVRFDLGSARLPRDLHPVAWWWWALGMATAASLTTNPLLLLLGMGVAAFVVSVRRSDQPWADSFRLYVWLGVAIVLIRVVFRIVFGGGYPGQVLFGLPVLPLPGWAEGLTLFGPVTRESLLAGLYDGLRLAAVVICVGAANALANPKRLLRSVPPALYEVGTALVVAVTVLPQFADSARRVRAAQALRAGASGRLGRLRRFLVPVLEDALEQSLALAAGMDARGYGRVADSTRAGRRLTGALMLTGLCGICVGVYAVLDQTAPRYLALPMLGLGLLAAGAGLLSAARRVVRTRYRPDPWWWPEVVVVLGGVLAGAAGWLLSHRQPAVAYPDLVSFPMVTGLALAGPVVALLTAWCAPPPLVRALPSAALPAPQGVAA